MLSKKITQIRVTKLRVMKTIGYRISATIIAQVLCWTLFQRFEANLGVAIVDTIQAFWYYIYEGFWKD